MSAEELISHYDYHLPEHLIAQQPADQRDASRLMVIDRHSQTISHHVFRDLPGLLAAGDLLVMNNTRVVPARLNGIRTATGGKWEGLFLREEVDQQWRLIGQTRGTLQAGERITLLPNNRPQPADSSAEISTISMEPSPTEHDPKRHCPAVELLLKERQPGGEWICQPLTTLSTLEVLEEFGTLPLPHYMQRSASAADWERYQTTYAERPGAVAAPTAGLHFTRQIFQQCRLRGIETSQVTLHVGLGTFRPVSVEHLHDHQMHHEWCELPAETVQAIDRAQARKSRVVAVGTTCVRTLESVAQLGKLSPWTGETNLFIRPPFKFGVVDALVTNFHLPKSTLLVLVCTFAGRELVLRAYAEAIKNRYRFYSYGDAMLIL